MGFVRQGVRLRAAPTHTEVGQFSHLPEISSPVSCIERCTCVWRHRNWQVFASHTVVPSDFLSFLFYCAAHAPVCRACCSWRWCILLSKDARLRTYVAIAAFAGLLPSAKKQCQQ